MCSIIVLVILNFISFICFCMLLKEYKDLKFKYEILEIKEQSFNELWWNKSKEEMKRVEENYELKQKNKELERVVREFKDVIKNNIPERSTKENGNTRNF